MSQDKILIQMHPRAFAAFGADLVTNDIVAIIELVKNAYDAFSYEVYVTIGRCDGKQFIEIRDNGCGMTKKVIRDVWAVVATPYKRDNPIIERGNKKRRVSGNKGMGRFASARLGDKLEIITKTVSDGFIKVNIDWNLFYMSDNMKECSITMSDDVIDNRIENTGTILRISELHSVWDESNIIELKDNLSRLLSPFEKVSDFAIYFKTENNNEPCLRLEPPEFVRYPTYKICGSSDEIGNVNWTYFFKPVNKKEPIKTKGNSTWKQIYDNIDKKKRGLYSENGANCGKFQFEIRVWDLDKESVLEVSETFKIEKTQSIRETIRTYKGLSVYRDNVIVLPKSEASRDWIGLDLRRVSGIGRRISTSQIIGIVKISQDNNPGIRDTTDREKLVDTREYKEFCSILMYIIGVLESLRLNDRIVKREEPTLSDFLEKLSPQSLVEKVKIAAASGESTGQVVEYINEFNEQAQEGLKTLKNRLIYYGQVASVGSIAMLILHEIRTSMTIIHTFLSHVLKKCNPLSGKTQEYYDDAMRGYQRLLLVADSFAPLYKNGLSKEIHWCSLKESIELSIKMLSKKIKEDKITVESIIDDNILVGMHSGEMQTILINLIDNAIYWTSQNDKGEKKVQIRIYEIMEDEGRIKIAVDDTGLGVNNDDAEKIFEPGVTAKPNGIGMGLVIVSEIVGQHSGKVGVIIPGYLDGATFVFDVPLKRNWR